MMQYASGQAFRRALETRLRKMARGQRISIVRLRKQVVFERFVARLQISNDKSWVLKGGLAMQLRLGTQSRTTMDIDLLKTKKAGGILSTLREATALDLGDWFNFEVSDPETPIQDVYAGQRFHVICLVDGRTFEEFAVDVGVDDPILEPLDQLTFAPVLSFAGIAPVEVLAYSAAQQIAEKLHALTRTYTSGTSSRVKDLVDILLLSMHEDLDVKRLEKAIRLTFDNRGTHPIPESLPELSQSLSREYDRIARELDLTEIDFARAQQKVKVFLTPTLTSLSSKI